MAYTKLHQSLVTSTIWREPTPTRIVWVTMMAIADKNGEVMASIPGLADLSRVTLEECEAALTAFLSPDKYSRTKTMEGRRIQEIEGGWFLINHPHYRAMASKEDATQKASERMARHRRNKALHGVTSPLQSATVSKNRDIAEAEAEAEADSRISESDNTLPAKPAKREPNPLFDALCEFEGIPLTEIGSAGARIGTALKAIKAVTPEVTVEEVRRRGENYRLHFSGGAITANALSKHWGKCHASPIAKSAAVPWQVKSHETVHSDGFFGKEYQKS